MAAEVSIFLFLLIGIFNLKLLASPSSQYGMGGSSSGRVNNINADVRTPFAATYNPAVLAAQSEPLFSVGTYASGSQYGTLETAEGPYTPNVEAKGIWSLGLTYPFFLPHFLDRSMGFGLALTGPFGKLRSFSSYQPQDFYLLRYGASDSQFAAVLGTSVEVIPQHLYIGGGLSFFLSGAGNAISNLDTNNPTGRMAFDVGMQSAAIVGIYGTLDKAGVGLVYHQEKDPTFIQNFTGIIPIGNSSVEQPLLATTSLYYEPHTFDFDFQHEFETLTLSLGVEYQIWRNYRPPILIEQIVDASGNTHTTQTPIFPMRNTWNPKVSIEIPLFGRRFTLSSGYQYRPSPVKDLSGVSNVLDSDTHILGLSFSHHVAANEWFTFPFSWGLFGQTHRMVERQVIKSNPQAIGGPGYTFQGHSTTYGAFVEAPL